MASAPAARPQLLPAALIAAAAGIAAALAVLLAIGSLAVAAGFLAAALVIAAGVAIAIRAAPSGPAAAAEPDWSIVRTLAGGSGDAVAVTDRAGRLVCANDRFQQLFAGLPNPPNLPVGEAGSTALAAAGRAAWRDGRGAVDRVLARGIAIAAEIERAGEQDDMLVWRFRGAEGLDVGATVEGLVAGVTGDRLGAAGIMICDRRRRRPRPRRQPRVPRPCHGP